jgi:hypothetical protein
MVAIKNMRLYLSSMYYVRVYTIISSRITSVVLGSMVQYSITILFYTILLKITERSYFIVP